MPQLTISYEPSQVCAIISASEDLSQAIWNRVFQACLQADPELEINHKEIVMSWANALPIFLEIGTLRQPLGFTMKAVGEAEQRLATFREDRKMVKQAKENSPTFKTDSELMFSLQEKGFTRRHLKPFQLRDLKVLLALKNGANFSVPGAGKTTVAFASHIIIAEPQLSLLVVGPKNAFAAWDDVVSDCMDDNSPNNGAEAFTRLDSSDDVISSLMHSNDRRRFIMTYERFVRVESIVKAFLRRRPTHVILDESHRIKAGDLSQRGRSLLSISPLPVRKDILSGTPAPHSLGDLSPQFDFLWPGTLIGHKITASDSPRNIVRNLYVRTTKHELGLPPVSRKFVHVEMSDAQLLLYSIIRSEAVAQLSGIRQNTNVDLIRARRCVMRLLQASTNPPAAALPMASEATDKADEMNDLLNAIISEGNSRKLLEVVRIAREFAKEDKKTVIWTIFRDTIERLEHLLSDLNPAVLHGGVPVGSSEDIATREGRIRRFHDDDTCKVVIANPAACSEGISLHRVCHNAIYVDRSYNAAHYLQSIDRIHRLGLPQDIETKITIVQSVAPHRVGSIDHSVSRRLLSKMRMMEGVLDDEDIRLLALDEEQAEPPVDRDITFDDLADILDQLQSPEIPSEDNQA